MRNAVVCFCLISLCPAVPAGQSAYAVDDFDLAAKPFLTKYCVKCHSGGKKARGGVDFQAATAGNAAASFEQWESAAELLREGQMPPDGELQPNEEDRTRFLEWYQAAFVESVDPHPGYFQPRRLCAHEYRNTLRSLFGFDLEVAIIEAEQTVAETSLVMKLLPTDPPGASGFRNDTHTSPLTTVLWDQYSYLADAGLEELFSEKRRTLLEKTVGPVAESGLTLAQAQKLVESFVPRAYRRPVPDEELLQAVSRIGAADDVESALKVELKAVLMSPAFLYRGFLMQRAPGRQVAVDDFELAERLSYFLWADMPDQLLFESAREGTLRQPDVFEAQVQRMLDSGKSRNLADDFALQWLTLDQIARQSKQPPQAHALRSQPRDFVNYLFAEDRPLLELIDSRTAFVNPFTAGHYGRDRQQLGSFSKPRGVEVKAFPNRKIHLVHTKSRGGILTMPGILEMNRGPVVRGTWILERILGEHLPDPPPDVGQVAGSPRGRNLTFRQRFEMHRSKPSCAVCHDRIDPLGFALQQYESQNFNAKSTADTSGQLPGGEKFEDFAGLKQLLLTTRREQIIRNIVERTLSYALCRKLQLHDRPTVDQLVQTLSDSDGTYRALVREITASLPFRETAFRNPESAKPDPALRETNPVFATKPEASP